MGRWASGLTASAVSTGRSSGRFQSQPRGERIEIYGRSEAVFNVAQVLEQVLETRHLPSIAASLT
jgi:hypothetical protein